MALREILHTQHGLRLHAAPAAFTARAQRLACWCLGDYWLTVRFRSKGHISMPIKNKRSDVQQLPKAPCVVPKLPRRAPIKIRPTSRLIARAGGGGGAPGPPGGGGEGGITHGCPV